MNVVVDGCGCGRAETNNIGGNIVRVAKADIGDDNMSGM